MIAFTRTDGPNVCAKPTVRALRPALAAAYGQDRRPRAHGARRCEMLMIEPPAPAAIRVPTSAVSRNGPLRLTPSTLSNSSSVTVRDVVVERRHARVVDEDVDRPELARRRGRPGRRASSQRPTCAPIAERPAPVVLGDLRRERLAGRAVAAGDDDVRARRGEAERHRAAQPAAASGDQGHLAAEVEAAGGGGSSASPGLSGQRDAT